MGRNVSIILVFGIALGAACDGDSSAITDLSMELPPGDRDARARLAGLEVEVWDPSADACRRLVGWRTAVCGGACTPPPSPRDGGEVPGAEISLERLADGTFGSVDLVVPGDGPWDVVVHGLDDTGTAFLHGCKLVSSEVAATVRLFRPWCDVAACAGQLHPACPAEIDCSAPATDDPDGLGPPVCRPLAPVVFAWEQGGVACEPTGTSHTAPCRQARIECRVGETSPATDGVCPAASDPACGGTLADDLDCDGNFPGPCGPCMAGEMQACGSGACAPVATCEAGGTFGACEVPPGEAETCGGGDEDCDGIDDATDADAFAACNVGRAAGVPSADVCDTTLGCRCGASAACTGSRACCGGTCINVEASESSCGACGRACAPGTMCIRGMCEGPDGGMCTVGGCNEGRAPNRPRADRCTADDGCACGTGGICEEPQSCCGGTCMDGTCSDGGIDGCVPTSETCDGVDTDCDFVSDAIDPDALAECNAGRKEGAPAASECATDECRCGGGPACGTGLACCFGPEMFMCVPLGTNENCGACGDACDGGQTCTAGECVMM